MPGLRRLERASIIPYQGRVSELVLLLDQNLSYKLKRPIEPEFIGSLHVSDVGLNDADDELVWRFALSANHLVVSKVSTSRLPEGLRRSDDHVA